ncbi:hypothetical protein PILCRDRAFT_804776, partial [Piloderma croceum F 1598]
PNFIHKFTRCSGWRKTSHIHLFYNSCRPRVNCMVQPLLIGGAMAESIIGVLLGPIYPIVTDEASRILPRWLLTGAIG